MNADRRNRLILILLCTVAGLAVIYSAGMSRLWMMIQMEKDSEVAMLRKVAEQQEITKQAGALGEEAERRAELLSTLEQLMPSGDVYSWLLAEFEPLAAAQGVRDLKVGRPVRREEAISKAVLSRGYSAVSGSLSGAGHYREVGSFIAEVENRLPFMRLTQLTIDASRIGIAMAVQSERTLGFQMGYEVCVRAGSAAN